MITDPPKKLYHTSGTGGFYTNPFNDGELVYTLTGVVKRVPSKFKQKVVVGLKWNWQTGGMAHLSSREVLDVFVMRDTNYAIVKETHKNSAGEENVAAFTMSFSTIEAQLPDLEGPATLQEVPL